MKNSNVQIDQRARLTQKFNAARIDLLVVLALTALNIALLFTDGGYMLLFSASVPYYVLIFAAFNDVMLLGVVVAVVALVLYFLCWLLSKKRPVWLLIATALFVIDTLFLIFLYIAAEELSGILDLLIHVLVLYYLIGGYVAAKKLEALPPETPAEADEVPAEPME